MAKLFKKEQLISAFDIEGDFIKLAQVKIQNGKRLLSKLLAVKAQSSDPEDIIKSIRELSSKLKLPGSLILVNLPRHMVTVREVRMPSVSREELEGMINFQLSKLLPYPKEEIIYGYKVIETTEEGYSRIMLVLTHKDVIYKLLDLFSKSGIDIARIALSSESLANWYLSRQAEQERNLAAALIDIDSQAADIQVVYDGRIEFTRAITFPPKERLTKLSDEVRRSFLTYKRRKKSNVAKMILTGPETIVGEEAPLLKREYGIETVYINPLKAFPIDAECQLPSEEEVKRASFTTVLALAFNFDKLVLNLMPISIQRAKAAKFAKESLVVTGLLLLCVILGIGGIAWKHIDDKVGYLKYVNAEIKKTGPRVEELDAMVNNISIIKEQLDMKGTSIDVIRELYRIIPANISLTIFDFEEGDMCTFRGAAEELSNVFDFVTILENSSYFKNVKVRYATKRTIRKKTLTDFEIICGSVY